MSKLVFVLALYIRCLSALITTEQQLMNYCTGVVWAYPPDPLPTRARWSPATKTCIQWYKIQKTHAGAEAECQSHRPGGCNARLFHAVDESFVDLAAAEMFTQSLKGWVGGKKYAGLHPDYTANYQTLGDFRWYEGTQCTSKLNASVIASGGFNNVQQNATGDCLVYTLSQYTAEPCTIEANFYCEYYLGPAGNVDCEQAITAVDDLRDFCVDGGGDQMKWTSNTCVHHLTGTQSWESANTACQIAAPPGTTGRLVHATTPDLQALNAVFGLTHLGWVGAKRFSGDPSWIPGPGIKDWKWIERDDCRTNAFNATEMEPLFDPNSSYDVGWDCLYYTAGKFESKDCMLFVTDRVCQFYLGDGPNSNECGEQALPEIDGLKNYCEEEPENNLWLESTETCFRRYFDLKNKDDAALACAEAAPPGTIGRLAIIPNVVVADALDSTFSDLDKVWLGAERVTAGGTNITSWTWTEESAGQLCSKPADKTLNAISNITSENTSDCLMLNIDHGTLNDKLCAQADIGRICEFYYGDGPFTDGLCKPELKYSTLYQKQEVGKCGTKGIFHTETSVSKPGRCALLCWSMAEKCESYNYDPNGGKCELFSRNYDEAVGNGPTATCSFYKTV